MMDEKTKTALVAARKLDASDKKVVFKILLAAITWGFAMISGTLLVFSSGHQYIAIGMAFATSVIMAAHSSGLSVRWLETTNQAIYLCELTVDLLRRLNVYENERKNQTFSTEEN